MIKKSLSEYLTWEVVTTIIIWIFFIGIIYNRIENIELSMKKHDLRLDSIELKQNYNDVTLAKIETKLIGIDVGVQEVKVMIIKHLEKDSK